MQQHDVREFLSILRGLNILNVRCVEMAKETSKWQHKWKRVFIVLLFVFFTVLSLFVGAYEGVSIGTLLEGNERIRLIFWHSRVTRTMAIILSAAGLSVAGLVMQSISRNKFMSPSTAGTTDAAALGILISFVFLGSQTGFVQTVFAFIFALIGTLIFTLVISRLKIRETVYIPLLGMMYGGVISALSSVIAFQFGAIQFANMINLGSFARLGGFWGVYVVIVPLIIAVIFATKFSIIGLGEEFAKNLGVNYNRVVMTGLVIVSLISASTFVTVGPLPFVGLIVPNMATSFYGDNLKKSIYDLMFFGAVFVLICDIISRVIIFPTEMNVSLTISLVGGAIFMVYLVKGVFGNGTSSASS